MAALRLALHFTQRELRNRYLGSFSGGLWSLLQPLIQLAVYSFVFVYVFKTRVPGADAPGFVPFLVVALWPWTAFSESIVRSTTAIQDNAALIGKVALPREVLVVAIVASTFLLHLCGFVAVCVALAVFGIPVHLAFLPLAILAFIPLFGLALGFALIFSAAQVFVRDLAQALAQIITLWMFASPIFYSRAMLPEAYQGFLDFNPMTYYVELFRSLLLGSGTISTATHIISMFLAVFVLTLGWIMFRRLAPHFEDFL